MRSSVSIERMPTWKLVIYTTGQFGWSILVTLVGLLTYFYIPPETGEAAFPELVTREAVLGITVVGICGLVAEWIGMILDPGMAAVSDRTTSRVGRRKIYMLISAAPFAVLTYFMFHPPTAQVSRINSIWIIAVTVLFNLFRGMYMIPYGALAPELGYSSKIRMFISTFHSVAWALGFILAGTLIFTFKDMLQNSFGMTPLAAFRTIAAAYSILGFILTMLPSIVIDEERYCAGHVSSEPPIHALVQAFRNRDFLIITIANTIYSMADRILHLGLVYFVTILVGLEEAMVGTLGAVMFLLSFLWYYPLNRIAEKVSKKKLVSLGFILQGVVLLMFGAADIVPIPGMVWAWCIIAVLSVMAAITGIVPAAVIAEVIRADGVRTGVYKEATYGAAMSIFAKIPMSITVFAFPAMILLGRSPENPFGVRLAAIVAVALMAAALVLWGFYNEKGTLEVLSRDE